MIHATEKQIKRVISETHPQYFTYYQAGQFVEGRGWRKKRFKRKIGTSEDKLLSVELIGNPGGLKRVVFMSALHDPQVAHRNLLTVSAVLAAIVPGWSEATRQKLMGLIGRRGDITENFDGITYSLDILGKIPVAFISV